MNKMQMYSVYDKGLERYTPPMFCSSDVEARRSFQQFAKPLDRAIYENVFSLQLIGLFDSSTGEIESVGPDLIERNDSDFYRRFKDGKIEEN